MILFLKGIDNGMIFGTVVYRFLCHCQKAPDCVPRNSQYGCSCTFRLCLAVHSVHSCPVFQIFHLFLLLSVCLAYRRVFYIDFRGGSILSVKFSRYSVRREPGSLTYCHLRWVNFPHKSWVSFNYKSIGRANWLFADTIHGAMVNAIMYSIAETAKANQANILIYLQYLFEQIPLRRMEGDKE